MTKKFTLFLIFSIALLIFSGCSSNLYSNKTVSENSDSTETELAQQTRSTEASPSVHTQEPVKDSGAAENSQTAQATDTKQIEIIDYSKVKPNESGQIMVVMFHNFVESYPSKGNNEYTTTFDEFEKLLTELYEKKYRLISLTDLLNNNINVPAGCIPMVFTFDDGTSGQFNLVEENGRLVVNPKSAVGIMEEFNKKHSDFGLQGTFYVNLGGSTFPGAGSLSERLNYLIEKGFEIGNHTKTHVSLPTIKTPQKMMEEVGGNQVLMNQLVPGYYFNSFSLPFGNASKDLRDYVIKGNFEGINYEHSAIMLVGANPAPSPVSPNFNPMAIPRVRSSGQKPVECDLAWWLETLGKGSSQYISDGNPDTVTVPKDKQNNVDMSRLNGKQLVTY